MTKNTTAEELIEVLGIGDALRVMEAFPGHEVYVARVQTPDTVAAMKLGFSLAERLAVRWGGEKLYIPDCRAVLRQRRDEAIRSRVRMGMAMKVVGELFGISRPRVKQICKRDGVSPVALGEKQLELTL